MKNDLKISEATVINCTTKKLATEVLKIGDQLDYTWADGSSFNVWDEWHIHKSDTCYNLHAGDYGDKYIYKRLGYNIMGAEEFIKLHSN